MTPSSGPQAGGTLVTMFGHNLTIGNQNITVCFKTNTESRPFVIASVVKERVLEDQIVAATPPSHGASELTGVEIVIDGSTHREMVAEFKYLPDPIIDTIHPSKSIVR